MGIWIWAMIVVLALIAIVVVGKQSHAQAHRPVIRDEREREPRV